MASSKPQRPYSSSPPSPNLNLKLTRANSEFYAAPSFDGPKKKTSSLLPSPTTVQTILLDVKPLPDRPSGASRDNEGSSPAASFKSVSSNPGSPSITYTQPTVALTMASPDHPRPSRSSLNIPRTDAEGDVFMDSLEEPFERSQQPFKVNPSDVPARKPSTAAGLTENGLRGLAKIKRLSSEGLSLSREGSPVLAPVSVEEQREIDRTRTLLNRIDELNTLTSQLQVNLNDALQMKQTLEEDQARTRKAFQDLHRQHQELQAKTAKRERDYEIMSKNYLDHVRLIRATDDDHSTIIDRLTQLKAAIEHLVRKTQGSRSINLNRAAAIEHFRQSGLLKSFPVPEDRLEPYHLNLFMESAIMSALVSAFFDKPLCCVFDYNKGFQEIYDWMYVRNDKLAVRWRQQLCVMITQDPATKLRQEKVVAATASTLTDLISKVYTNSSEGPKIREMCNKAFELSVAMTGLEYVISPASIPLGTPFDEENMGSSLKSDPEGNVALVIFPAFRDQNAFNIRPKVWCC
ncbi:hypothetical protein BGZ75_007958 [Mortierella antarctica]|uniref:Uncharacterized protein n=1 Tax=Mortierella alpina TaxID=64518 RepID=A0A9P7ZXJ7_MORAP|nr:hypothetical protein BGZ75_007958 [Mortierella antarctica]KAG9320418.1 hypothetical protein KVV02_008358 [Mortierella alpina]